MQVLVFKTSVKNEMEILQLKPKLNKLIQRTDSWNFDLEDCDRILRIESDSVKACCIKVELHSMNFECTELE